MLSGFGELLKTGLLDAELWPKVLQYDLDTMDIPSLTPLIHQAVAVKERIVASDPREQGPRKALNLGHTFGHAIEEIALGAMPHGYAVVYGMIAELYLSVTQLGCPREPLQQLTQLMLHYYGKPQCKCSDREPLIALMQQDKKNERADEINCTLLHSVGSPAINQVISPDAAREALDYLFSL
jgi:3-dehydroquinate synthase